MAASFILHLRALQQLNQIVGHRTWHISQTLPSLIQRPAFHSGRRDWNFEERNEEKSVEIQNEEPTRGPDIISRPGESLIFNGVPYEKIPIAHIKASYNNTIITITDHVSGEIFVKCSCGTEGFKNAKKCTSIAGQTVGIAAATKALAKDMKMVRVLVRGVGPGRQSSLKGIQMGGLDIISITDNTPVPHNGCKPRKARRL